MQTSERNMGVDLLRIVSMGMVVFLHVLLRGGILTSAGSLSINYKVAWGFETAAYCAVNCYGLISGYVGYKSKFRVSNLVMLWLRVVWYTLLITVFFAISGRAIIGKTEWLSAILPASTEQYWYFTAYVGMFFFIPILNMFIENASRRKLEGVVSACIFLFSVLPTVFRRDIFYLSEGYSAFWLGILYLIGGYLAKYRIGQKIKSKYLICGYAICVVLSWGVKMLMDRRALMIYGILPDKDLLISYLSPTILFAAIFLLLAFSKFNVSVIGKSIIGILAPLSFSVYLIHYNPLVKINILQDRFSGYVQYGVLKFIVMLIATVLVIFVGCVLIDSVREFLFKVLKLRQKIISFESFIARRIEKKYNK